MWKFYCDCCEKEVVKGEPTFEIRKYKKKMVMRTVCEDCADKVLELLGGETEGGESEE